MAVPFILLGGAALAGITGAVKSVSAHTKNANAKQIVAEAQNIYDEAREMLEEQRTCTAECLKRLGALKVDIWSKEMNDFIRTFRAFKNVRMESDVAGDERLKLKCQGTENLKNMEVAALRATEIARAGVASLGTGVLAGIASYGGAMMFASASTGTAIASLSGVAATNATLAWFGGGALTAGGLGMAGGTLVLGGIVVGPVLAAAGLIMNAKADENLASAEATADPELKAHIDEAEKAAQLYDASRNTGNEVLDVVLTEKSLLCESRRIQLNAVTDGSCLNFFEASDLYALFANMLDHAIESAVKVPEPERRCIDLLVCTRQSFVVVNVISPDRPAESADTRAAHYAVKVTNRIVQKYKGTLTTESQNGFFAVKIIFPQGK